MMLIALDKAQGCFRSPGARSIIWKISGRIILPGFENRNGRLPNGLALRLGMTTPKTVLLILVER
jgi:hypothetical protein